MPTTAIAGVQAVAGLTADANFPYVGITVIFVIADVLSILRITDFLPLPPTPSSY